MKRRTLQLLAIVAVMILPLLASACGSNDISSIIEDTKTTLSTPANVRIEDGSLMWNPVEYASGYTVSIDGREYPVSDFRYPIDQVKDGDHVFKVKANGDGVLYVSSAFSAEYQAEIKEGKKASSGYYGQFDELTKNESFLGYGFDVIRSSVFSDKYVKLSFPIFDHEGLMNQRLVKVDSKQSTVDDIFSSEMDKFLEDWNVSANVNVSWGKKKVGGSVEVEAKYSGGVENAKSHSFHCISINNQKFYIVMQSDLNTYRTILSDSFKSDLYSDMEPSQLFDKYGTHFITSAVMGGKINSYYLYSSEEEKSYHDIQTKVSVEVRYLTGKTNVDVSGGYRQEAESQNIYIKNTLEVIGGGDFGMMSDADLTANYAAWEKSLNDHPSLMGIKDTSSLIPIWDLIDSSLDTRTYTWDYGNGISGSGSRSQQLQAFFQAYGLDAYNDLLTSSGLPEQIAPNAIENVRINGMTSNVDDYEVFTGTGNDISFDVKPDLAWGYTKSASVSGISPYATVRNDNGLILEISPVCPNGEVIPIILSAGSVRKQINVRVVKRYSVTFESNGGSTVPTYYNIRHGSQIDEPNNPVKDGYRFEGWYRDPDFAAGTEYPFGITSVKENMTLYAKWSKIHKLTYKLDGQNYGDPEFYCAGEEFSVRPVPEKEGYTFSGWKVNGMNLPSVMPNVDTVIEGTFTINSYSLKYYVDGVSYHESSLKFGDKITVLAEPSRTGQTFSGWKCSLGVIPETMPATDVVISGVFSIKSFQVTYYLNNQLYATKTVNYNEPIPLLVPDEIPTGHLFDKWKMKQNTSLILVPDLMPERNIELYSTTVPVSYTVSYNANLGTGNMDPISMTYDQSKTLSKNLYTRDGYQFAGWNTKKDGSGASYNDQQSVKNLSAKSNADVILYAMWKVDPYSIAKYVETEALVSDSDGVNSYVIYSQIDSIPNSISGKVIIDLRAESDPNFMNHARRTDNWTWGKGNYGMLDIYPGSEIWLIGKEETVYTHTAWAFVTFEKGDSCKLHIKNFSMNGSGSNVFATYSCENDINVEMEIIGECTFTGGYYANSLHIPEVNLKVFGSGLLNVRSGEVPDGGIIGTIGIFCRKLTVCDSIKLNVVGGNGSRGSDGISVESARDTWTYPTNGTNGGDGGYAVSCSSLNVQDSTIVVLKGGNGGRGGDGGNKYGSARYDGTPKLPGGGFGGNGGNGCLALNADAETSFSSGCSVTLTPGNGGDGGNGGCGGSSLKYLLDKADYGGDGGRGGDGGNGLVPGKGGDGGAAGTSFDSNRNGGSYGPGNKGNILEAFTKNPF